MKNDSQLQPDGVAAPYCGPLLDAAPMTVGPQDGVAMLTGEIGSDGATRHAESPAPRIPGLEAQAVEMSVKLPQLGKRTDADLAESTRHVLSWTSSLATNAVKVAVEGGWLTLSGDVEWPFQRQDAEASVRHLPGLVGIRNQVVIKPALSTRALGSGSRAFLKRRAADDAKAIAVEVSGASVSLPGMGRTDDEHGHANRTTQAGVGVHRVAEQTNLAC